MAIDSDVTLPRLTASGAGLSNNKDSDKTLPKITASGAADSNAAISDKTLPSIQADGAALSSTIATSEQRLPVIRAVGVAVTSTIATSDVTLHIITAVGAGVTARHGESEVELPVILGVGTAVTGTKAQSDVTLALILASGRAYEIALGDVVTPENPYNEPQEAWVINYETNAPSRYHRYPANSMCKFKGKTFVANAAGIYEVSGTTDAGQQINGQVTFPRSDFGEAKNKRLPYVYLGIRSTGRMQLKVIANEDKARYYALNSGRDAARGSRADIGKGLQARYWQLAVANVDGAAFMLDSLEFAPTTMNRYGV